MKEKKRFKCTWIRTVKIRVPTVVPWVKNPTAEALGHCRGTDSIHGSVEWIKRPGTATATVQVAAAVAQIQCLAWELPYTEGTAITKYIYIKICFCRYILFLIPNIDIAFFLFLICLARDLSIFSVQELPFYFGSFSIVQLLVH